MNVFVNCLPHEKATTMDDSKDLPSKGINRILLLF